MKYSTIRLSIDLDFFYSVDVTAASKERPPRYTPETFGVFADIQAYAIRLFMDNPLFRLDNIKPSTNGSADAQAVSMLEQKRDENNPQPYYDSVLQYLQTQHQSNSCYVIAHAVDAQGRIYNSIIFDIKASDHLLDSQIAGPRVDNRNKNLKLRRNLGTPVDQIDVKPMYIKVKVVRQYSKLNPYPYQIELRMLFNGFHDEFTYTYTDVQSAKDAIKQYYDESCDMIKKVVNGEAKLLADSKDITSSSALNDGTGLFTYRNLPSVANEFEQYLNRHNNFPDMQDITWECLNAYYADEELTVYVRDNLGDELEYSIDVEISHMDSQRYMQETYEELANDIYEEYNWNDI